MSWRDGFYEAVRVYVDLPEGSVVTSVEEETVSSGYCETCYYESQETIIRYTTPDGESKVTSSYMNMSEFMAAL